jgi:hypothetical protein
MGTLAGSGRRVGRYTGIRRDERALRVPNVGSHSSSRRERGSLLGPKPLDMSTQAPPKTHCPNCGAKLHRPDLSLCAYCAMPLDIASKPAPIDDETIQRLKRMREHKSFAAAMEFCPRSYDVEQKAARLLSIAALLAVVALVCGIIAVWRASSAGWTNAWTFVAALCALATVVCLVLPSLLRKRDVARPVLRRPALVVVRRSEMDPSSGTTYFFTLRFDDGAEGEFRWPGHGTSHEPMSNGYSGIAYTRGEQLVDFRRLT